MPAWGVASVIERTGPAVRGFAPGEAIALLRWSSTPSTLRTMKRT
jgi:hypothetical protein